MGFFGPNPRWGCKHYFPHWRVEKQPENARAMDWIRFLMLTSADNSTTVIAVRGTLESCFGEVFGYVDVAMILGWFLDLFLLQCRCEGIGPHVQGCKDQTGAIWRHWHGKVLTHFPWDLLLGNDTTTSTKSSYIRTCRYIYIFACLYTKYIIYNMIIIYIYPYH